MPERIYTSAEDGALEALEETPSSTEDELQALIAEHPELLDGGANQSWRRGAAGYSSPARKVSLRLRVQPPDGPLIT